MHKLKQIFDKYCREKGLDISFSSDMPAGYETANGMYDITLSTLFLNTELLAEMPEYEQLFYLFHELRHAEQYARPEQLGEAVRRSMSYAIMYDGECFRRAEREWKGCRLEGTEEYFKSLYLGQPYERDANAFAYGRVRELCGDSAELRELAAFWLPESTPAEEEYMRIYDEIDRRTAGAKAKPVPVLDHIHITVSNLARAEQFYDRLLPLLGYDIALKEHDSVPEHEYEIVEYHHRALSIGLVSPRSAYSEDAPCRRRPGALHHIAFRVCEPSEVDRLFKLVRELPAVIVREPQLYPEYCPDYYAFFFKDSEGTELEIVSLERERYFPV